MTLVIVTVVKRMLAVLGFELTTPGVTARVATDRATGARPTVNYVEIGIPNLL